MPTRPGAYRAADVESSAAPPPLDPTGLTWEQVLSEVEADIDATSALVTSLTSDSAPAPADTQLRSAGPVLPPLSQMPPVPPQLAQRIDAARARITVLESELRAELAALGQLRAQQAAQALRAARLAAAAREGAANSPAFFDSRV